MKIIHTADWHIGKILHRNDLVEDISLFFDWLISFLREEDANVLLVSGDIFDLANPSNRDTALYYKILLQLSQLNIKVIITGGNHDSISLLEAPSGLLQTLNIHVVGGAKDNISNEIIPCSNPDGSIGCIILAVPFLRDKDLRASLPADQLMDKTKTTETGIRHHYERLVDLAKSTYGDDVPVIAMGHLFMKGAVTSDSEREVHIGSLDGLALDVIPTGIDYMALGHIHKPQKVHNLKHVRYCGSPIFLDFSERNYEKRIISVTFEQKKVVEIKSHIIPIAREMIRFSGTLESVKRDVENFKNTRPLCAFIEVEIVEKAMDVLKVQELEDWREKSGSDHYKIIKSRISFENSNTETMENAPTLVNKSINELSPLDIFRQKMVESVVDEASTLSLTDAYMQLLEEINQ